MSPSESPRVMGLIAGMGTLPVLEAQSLRERGHRVACVGLSGQYVAELPEACDWFAPAGVARLGRWIRLLRKWGAEEAVMVGGVRKESMYHPLRMVRQLPDLRAARVWYRTTRNDKRDQTLLAAVADELAASGVRLIDTTRYIPEHMATPGVMTRRQPTEAQQADIAFGWPVLQQVSSMDIGQAIAVRNRDFIAVEAMEGTAQMITRAGELCRSGGWTMLKGCPPTKDLRFDVPAVGLDTIEQLKAAGAKCLGLTAGRVILIDKPKVLEAADKAGIAIVGVED